MAPAGWQFSLDGNWAVFAGTRMPVCAPSGVAFRCSDNCNRIGVAAGYKPAGRTGLRLVFLAELARETGITDPVYNYSARSVAKGLT